MRPTAAPATDPGGPALRVRGLRHAYQAAPVLHGVDLDVPRGATVAVLGPSGCGKSTLLRLVAGFERPTAGTVELAGRAVAGAGRWVPPERRPIGYVAQEGGLFPHLDVRANLGFGLPRACRDRATVDALLRLVDLDARFLDRFPHQLSGGQQQRVALARTLARRPAVVLLDEPFSALDTDLRAATRAAMAEALRTSGVTTVLVTHDQGEALSFADVVAVMSAGRFTQVGAAREVYDRPVDVETARLVGPTVLLDGTPRADGSADTPLGRLPLRGGRPGAVTGGPVPLLLRPEQLQVRAAEQGAGTVIRSAYYGHDRVVEVAWPGLPTALRARVAGGLELAVGDRVEVGVRGTALPLG